MDETSFASGERSLTSAFRQPLVGGQVLPKKNFKFKSSLMGNEVGAMGFKKAKRRADAKKLM